MTPERGSAPVGTEAQEKRLPEAWSSKPTAILHSGLLHISFAVRRARNRLARLIATRDEVFSSDMSLVVDRLTLENESLRERLRSVA